MPAIGEISRQKWADYVRENQTRLKVRLIARITSEIMEREIPEYLYHKIIHAGEIYGEEFTIHQDWEKEFWEEIWDALAYEGGNDLSNNE